MSKVKPNPVNWPPSFLDSVTPIMKEYGDKLRRATQELDNLWNEMHAAKAARIEAKENGDSQLAAQAWQETAFAYQSRYNRKSQFIRTIAPAAIKLCQLVSQQIQHGGLVDLEKAELTLRLAELEKPLLPLHKT